MQFLQSFDRADLQFIEEKQLKKIREELQKEFKAINEGSSDLVDIEDHDKELEERLFDLIHFQDHSSEPQGLFMEHLEGE